MAYMGLGTLVPGCPQVLSDDFYVQRTSVGGQGSAEGGAAGLNDAGGTSTEAGAGGAAGDIAIGGTTAEDGGTAATGGETTTDGGTDATGGESTTEGGTAATGGESSTEAGAVATGGESTTEGGTAATGGESSTEGGTAATGGWTTITGGKTATGGKSTNSGGRTGTGGISATGGATSTPYGPLCASAVVKDGPCQVVGTQPCYKTCGPSSVGYKSETCVGGTYSEQSNCSFPVGSDYSCYKLPAVRPPTCPTATVPRAGQTCTVAECIVCFGGTITAPTYQDSTGTQKNGYCVCLDTGTWTCASTSSWPCPGSAGC
jgi:hypothetical protein